MIVSELVAEIAKRLNDENNIMYSADIIKSYLFPAMSIVFLSEGLTLADYPGLISTQIVSSNSYTFTTPIRRVISVKGSSNSVRYIPKTVEDIDALTGSDFLDPEDGERFYYVVGNVFYLYGNAGSDSDVSVRVLYYPGVLDDSAELDNYYSTSFIELAVRETINTILKEIDVRT